MTLQIDLLETSFRLVCDRQTDLTNCFYNTLFADYPQVKPLFSGTDMNQQGQKLFASLVLVVDNLTKPDTLTDALQGLGTKHMKYGVIPEHYPMVGSALLKSMAFVLEDRWTAEVAAAWAEAYSAITSIMLSGCDYPQEILNLET